MAQQQVGRKDSRGTPYAATVSTDEAVRDLMGRKDPELLPWSKTPSFNRAMRGFGAFMAAYITLVLIIGGIISVTLGQAALGAELIVAIFILVVVGYIPLARFLYYRGIKPKRPSMDGAVLGTAYTHYIEVHHAVEPGSTEPASMKAMLAGETEEYAIDYEREPNPHVVIVGGSGSGKTVTLRAFMVRNCINLGVPFLIIDWNGEQEDWARECGATLWKVPSTMKLNPFARRGKNAADRTGLLMDLFQFGAGLTYLQAGRLRTMSYQMYQDGGEPTLVEIWRQAAEAMGDRRKPADERQYMAWIEQRLKMVQRVIGYEPEEFWDGLLARNNIVSLRGLSEVEKGVAAYAIFQRVYEIFNEKPELNGKMRLMLALDEAWKILQSQQMDKQEALPSQIVRLGRKYGFGILVSTQQMTDLPSAFINSSAVQIVHRYRETSTTMSVAGLYNLGQFETAYLNTAKPGEAMVLDQYRNQLGQWWLDYIKVDMVTKNELNVLKELYEPYEPEPIKETQMPIDEWHEGGGPEKPKEPEKPETPVEESRMPFPPPADRPTATIHAALLALYHNEGAPFADLARYLKNKGFITSDPTIYGTKERQGVFDIAFKLGLAEKGQEGYRLSKNGERWVKPEAILESESEIGSDLHKQILMKTIEYLHERNMLVIAPSEREAPDLVAYPADKKKKYLWDDVNRRAYEIQTTARKDSIEANKNKNKKYKLPITWVTYDEGILDEIKKLTENKDEYLIIKV